MRYLLDTHVLVWLFEGNPRLPVNVRALYEARENEVLFSTASVWELAIKLSIGKLGLATSLPQFMKSVVARGVRLLDIGVEHAVLVEMLPFHHRDPFDRMLVAQSKHEGAHIISGDAQLDAYAVKRVWG